jgi:predicted O-methyltransferase YrrM
MRPGFLRRAFRRLLREEWPQLEANVLEVRDLPRLKKAMGWSEDPILEGAHLHGFDYLVDLNDRRLRDAEALGVACRNGDSKLLMEIGTGLGYSTALMARNAPQARVLTVNIPPEEIATGGKNTPFAPRREQIGSYYRELGLANVEQIYANTAVWEPPVDGIDVAFIDGCHDADFVYNDTVKILRHMRPGGVVLWHDFNPSLARVYDFRILGWGCTGFHSRVHHDRKYRLWLR